jgi:5-methylcytosine-specific restriction endonuclease McrA
MSTTSGGRKWTLVEERDRLTKKQIREIFMRQDGRCPNCSQQLQVKGHLPVEFIDEHVNPLWRGGSNELKNRELWCKLCAGDKTSMEATQRAKGNHVRDKYIGVEEKKPGGFSRRYKRKMNGDVIDERRLGNSRRQ